MRKRPAIVANVSKNTASGRAIEAVKKNRQVDRFVFGDETIRRPGIRRQCVNELNSFDLWMIYLKTVTLPVAAAWFDR
jgi:hypothetical protein